MEEQETTTGRGVRCSACGWVATLEEAFAERWAHWASGLGELHPYCGPCAERWFGPLDATPDMITPSARYHGDD